MRHLLAAALGTCLVALIAATLAPALTRSIPRPLHARAPLQPAATAPIRTLLFTRRIEWSAAPGTTATVEVTRKGQVKWRGKGTAGGDGDLVFQAENPDERVPAGDDYVIPGDVVSVAPGAARPITYTLAGLRVAVDVAADRVFGSAPPGEAVTVTVRPDLTRPTLVVRTLKAAADGRWSLNLAGTADLAPASDGWAVHTDAAGHQSVAHFAALLAEVQLGSPVLDGRGTLGDEVRVRLVSPEGVVGPVHTALLSGYRHSTPLGAFRWPYLLPLEPGAQLRLDLASPLAGASRTISVTVPALDLVPQAGSGRVTGKAPAGHVVVVEAIGPDDTTVRRQTTANVAGAFSVDFGADASFERGWRCYAMVEYGGALRVRALGVISQVRLQVYTERARGIALPGAAVSATLRGAGGQVLGQGTSMAQPDGRWQLNFEDPQNSRFVPIDPGSLLEIDLSGSGDPLSFTIPPLTARTDVDAETVSGEAIAGARVRVTAPTEPPVTVIAEADGAGHFLADFRGRADIEPPMAGTVEVTDRSGHAFTTEWAAVRLTAEVGDFGQVAGNAPVGREVHVTVLDPAGKVLGGAAQRSGLGFDDHEWRLHPRDVTGQRVVPEPGDTVRAVVGDDTAEMVVPDLRGAIHVESDLVTGKGPPGAAIEIQGPGSQAPALETSDAGGFFSHSFAGTLDLRYNEGVWVTAPIGRHRASHRILGPGLTLDLGAAELTGSVEPEQDITVTLQDSAGSTRALAQLRTNRRAEFVAAFRDPAGNRVHPQPGDRVRVAAPEAEVHKAITMTVPQLEIELEPIAARLGGRATPGGRLGVAFWEHFPRYDQRGEGNTAPAIQPDGTWRADFGKPVMFRPGARVEARYTEPGGHITVQDRIVPIVNVQHGGANVCGYAEQATPLRVAAVDAAGTARMAGSAVTGSDTRFALTLRDPSGRQIATDGGMTVRAEIGSQAVSVTLPALSLDVDWSTGEISGLGPRRADYFVSAPAFGCFGDAAPEAQLDLDRGRTEDDGRFTIDALRLDPAAPGFEIAFFTREGHRFYRQVFRSFGQVYLRTNRVAGRATPLSPVLAVLLDVAGIEHGRGSALSDSDGRFQIRLIDGDGAPVAIETGDRVRLEASGESPVIEAERLDFDFSPSGIEGVAPIGREVALTLTLRDGQALALTRQTDDRGRWVFVPAMVPPRAGWSFDQIARVRAVLATPGGHEIVVETGDDRDGALYLPWTERGR